MCSKNACEQLGSDVARVGKYQLQSNSNSLTSTAPRDEPRVNDGILARSGLPGSAGDVSALGCYVEVMFRGLAVVRGTGWTKPCSSTLRVFWMVYMSGSRAARTGVVMMTVPGFAILGPARRRSRWDRN